MFTSYINKNITSEIILLNDVNFDLLSLLTVISLVTMKTHRRL